MLFGRFPFLTKLFADAAYQGPVFANAAARQRLTSTRIASFPDHTPATDWNLSPVIRTYRPPSFGPFAVGKKLGRNTIGRARMRLVGVPWR
jgi:hypothetical protein